MRLWGIELNSWDYLAMFFAAVTIVAALGEWVFFWWADPGQYLAVGGFVATFLSVGFGASRRDLRGMERRVVGRLDSLAATVADREGQQRLVEGQQRLVEGQERQTHLLEQLVLSFRQRGTS